MRIFCQTSHAGTRAGAVKTAVAMAITLAMLAGFPGVAAAQGVVRSVHQDWQIRCDTPPGAKAETLLVLEQSPQGYRVLVMYDGPANGQPMEYWLPRS